MCRKRIDRERSGVHRYWMPDEKPPPRINLHITEPLMRALDDWRRRQIDIPSRADACRRLLVKALEDDARSVRGDAGGKAHIQ